MRKADLTLLRLFLGGGEPFTVRVGDHPKPPAKMIALARNSPRWVSRAAAFGWLGSFAHATSRAVVEDGGGLSELATRCCLN